MSPLPLPISVIGLFAVPPSIGKLGAAVLAKALVAPTIPDTVGYVEDLGPPETWIAAEVVVVDDE